MTPRKRTWTWREKVLAELGARGWAIADLGRKMGLKRIHDVHRWLSGEHEPKWSAVVQMADALGWSVARLLDEEGLPEVDVTAQEAQKFLVSLSADARKVVTLLGDPQAAAFLANAAEQYRRLRAGPGR